MKEDENECVICSDQNESMVCALCRWGWMHYVWYANECIMFTGENECIMYADNNECMILTLWNWLNNASRW